MATKIGSLAAFLRLDATGFKRELKRSRMQLKSFSRSVKRVTANMAGFLGVGSAASIGLLTRSTIQYADSLAKTADKIGLSTKQLQEWRYVADLSGIAANTLDIGVQRFGRRLGEAAQGGGTLVKALKTMNIDIRDQDGNLRDVNSVFTEYLQKLGSMEDVTLRNALAMAAFDTEGVALVNVAKNGAAGIQAMINEFNALGLVIDEKTLRQSERVNDQFTKFSTVMGVQVKKAVLDALPDIKSLMDILLRNREGLASTVASFVNMGTALFRAAAGAAKFMEELGKGIGIKAAQMFNPILIEDKIKNLERQLESSTRRIKSFVFDFLPESMQEEMKKGNQSLKDQIAVLRQSAKERQDLLDSFNKPTGKSEITAPKFDPFDPSKLGSHKTGVGKLKKDAKEYRDVMDQALDLIEQSFQADEAAMARQIAGLDHVVEAVKKDKDDLKGMFEELKQSSEGWAQSFADSLLDGQRNFKGFVDSVVRQIARIAITEWTKPFFANVSGFFGELLGFAGGGRPPVNMPSIVGERGPELFVPDRAGTIIPNNQLGGNTTLYIDVDARGADSSVDQKIRVGVEEAVRQAYYAVQNDAFRSGPIYKAMNS